MKLSTCMVLAAVLLTHMGTAEAKAYKGAEVYSLQTVLFGRMEMRMRMVRGGGLVSTFFTYKNGSETAGSTWEETDIEALGKDDAKTWQSNLITGNPRMTSEQVYAATSSLADGYHTYTLEWTPEYVSWSFDGTMVRKTEGGQASSLINAATLRFNAWASSATGWAGALDEAALPAYQFVNWIKYYRYENGQFVLDWTDEFDSFDKTRWSTGNWTFDGNLVDFDPANAAVQDSTLILIITKEDATGFSGTVPADDGSNGQGDGGVVVVTNPGSDSGCNVGGSRSHRASGLCPMLLVVGVAAFRRRRRRVGRSLALSRSGLTFAALLLGILAPRAASAVQGAELYRTTASFYGRFEARVRFAPGEGVVSSFFLWKDGSSSTTTWNELDYEKVNSPCRLTTNIWTAQGTQSSQTNTTAFDVCADYHTYVFEWTPDYIAWLIDGTEIRRVTGASVTEYTRNASAGMAIHFNIWAGNSSFGGVLNASTLPVRQYISWAQYSSYANGAFQMQWREDFNGSTVPSGWAVGNWSSPFNLSTHNPANVSFVNGIAVLSMTADNATGFTGTPPVDSSAGGTTGTGGTGGAGGRGGTTGSAGTTGAGGRGGTTGSAGTTGAGGRGGTTGSAGTTGAGGRGGTGGSASTGSGGTSSPGTGGSGVATGSAGSGAGGATSGSAGNGAGGDGGGSAGNAAGGSSGNAGAVGTGGASATGGSGGTGGEPPDGGCGCGTAGGLTGGAGPLAVLLLAACAVRRHRRRSHA